MHLSFLGGGIFLCGEIFSVAIFDYLFYQVHITIYHILPPVKFSPKEKGKENQRKTKFEPLFVYPKQPYPTMLSLGLVSLPINPLFGLSPITLPLP